MKHYDKGTLKVIGFASVVIVFSMLLIGVITYGFTEDELVRKWKDKDLVRIVESMAAKVDGHIEKAKETSLIMAKDPQLIRWVNGGEADEALGKDALQKLALLAKQFGYSNSFVVSALTRHYWSESGRIIDTVTPSDPDDRWFFDLIEAEKLIDVQVDYNEERKDTFVFVNAMMKDESEKPLAIVGVGMTLQLLSKQFQEFKYGENSNLWLINDSGEIVLSDRQEHFGKPIHDYVDSLLLGQLKNDGKIHVTESETAEGGLMDMISYPLSSTGLQLLFRVERKETVSVLQNIKTNTAIVSLFTFIMILALFYFISHRLANPYKRALQLNQELEAKVQVRTRELAERNDQLTDSIDYAKRIQESLLPQAAQWSAAGIRSHVKWQPRDTVGGDFYWVKPVSGGVWVALGDCTGHGVPGAFMTMLAISLLDRVAEQEEVHGPGEFLRQLNGLVKQTLHQQTGNGITDDGFDLGLLFIDHRRSRLSFSGAKLSLYVKDADGLRVLEGNRKSIGYRKTPEHYVYQEHETEFGPESSFFMASDGFYDQRGAETVYGFGKKRFQRLLEERQELPVSELVAELWRELEDYMGEAAQRDDITLLGFQIAASDVEASASERQPKLKRNIV
ncbi:SpoIIE family protein phosphatase [Paenibacillus silviterrae]|uniref:SpoIIE family protein phosphatase n=1 Tax=Paenibacillus silviterrae TaxID=3242194 RepID=UPI002542ED40|nr:SpoIIE family protein phosphatase [Paenibacillus chinjuensis]